jgi:hypothetical protein
LWVRAQQIYQESNNDPSVVHTVAYFLFDWATQIPTDEGKQLRHINTEGNQIKLISFCPCDLLCSLTASSLQTLSRRTAATPTQIPWNRSAIQPHSL